MVGVYVRAKLLSPIIVAEKWGGGRKSQGYDTTPKDTS